MNHIIRICFVVFAFSQLLAADERPHWIWTGERQQNVTLSKSIDVTKIVESAELTGVAESCTAEISLNNGNIAELESNSPMFSFDLTRKIQRGESTIQVDCRSTVGPPALFLRLVLKFQDGSSETIVTNTDWRANGKMATSLGRVADEPWGVNTRAIGINSFDDYTQWKRAINADKGTDPSAFEIAPGFEIELLRSATEEEGSWVSIAVDPKGRLVIARESKGLLRMSLSADGSQIKSVETIEDSLLECRGLLFAHDSLYVNANNSKGFYRLRDTDGDDQFDQVKLLREFPGGVGHGRNDLALGPDGKIYLIHGDSVDVPTDMIDHTSPLRENRRGKKMREGHVIRTDADGKTWELVTAGLRNPYGIDFNEDGQAFTYDADAEFDMGSPWYRPTQVKHLVVGGDFGWRGVTGDWPPYFHDHPDNTPPTITIGKGSPTGVKFGTKSNFPPKYKRALFILDWSYGRIIAVHMTPQGASYACRGETFLKGKPLNVTDLDFGHDGAMYFVTGGRKTKAGLYRVRYVGPEIKDQPLTQQQARRFEHAKSARGLLADLGPGADLDLIWHLLDSPGPTIRTAARIALEHHPVKTWRERALSETNPTMVTNTMMALARGGDGKTAVEQIHKLPLADVTESQKLMALHVYHLTKGLEKDSNEAMLKNLATLCTDVSPQVRQQAALLLAERGSTRAVSAIMPLLASSANQREQFLYLFALRNVREGWTMDDRRAYFNVLNETRHYLGGQGLPGFLQKIRDEAVATLNEDDKASLKSLIEFKPEATAISATKRPFVRKWTLKELTSALNNDDSRDLARGREMFVAAACNRCHRVGLVGTLVGPDLTGVSRRFSRRDILDSIISPSKVIADVYRSVAVETKDGKVYAGRVVPSGDYRSPTLRLATNPNKPHEMTEINKIDIVEQKTSNTSWMPEGLLNTLSEEEILDLLAFIESGGMLPRKDTKSPGQ